MNKEIWKNPKKEQSLDEAQTPLWFWNDKLEKDELLRQLKMKSDIGVKCTNPHARTNGGEGYIGGYLDDQWFDDIKTVLDYKKEHNEKMWLYDEIDWPAGTCNQTITLDENNREQYITIEHIQIPANEIYRAQLQYFDGGGLFGVTEETDQSAVAYNIMIVDQQTFEKYDLKKFFTYDMFGPELEFQSETDSIAFITKIHTDTYAQGGNEQVNYLDADVTRKFLASTYDKYAQHFEKDFGKTITTVFNDETRMCNPIPWSKDFAAEFLKLKGYDIRKEMYQVILPGEEAGRIRVDYFDVVATLFQKNYFGEIHAWCEQHQLKLFAHLLGEETMFGHARYSGDYMRQNRFQDVVGADFLGKGIGSLNIKFTSSAAHSYGKTRTAVEVFAGCGWDMTFDEYSRMVTWMFQQGMQTIINHGFFYSDRGNRKNDWPPSQFFQWQGWNQMSQGNDMIRRLAYATTDGINEAEVLVYHPTESFWLRYIPDTHFTHAFFRGAFLQDKKAIEIDKEEQLLLNGLSSQNLDFELIHKDAVSNFSVDQGAIINELTRQRFSVLIMPYTTVCPVEMARLCLSFVQSGGQIIFFGNMPRMGMSRTEDQEVLDIMEQMKNTENCKIYSAQEKEILFDKVNQLITHPISILEGTATTQNNHPAYPPYLIDPYMHGGEDITGVLFTRYLKAGYRHTLCMNYSAEPETIVMRVETEELPEIWDTFTGYIKEAEMVGREENAYQIRLELPCNHGVVVVSKMI